MEWCSFKEEQAALELGNDVIFFSGRSGRSMAVICNKYHSSIGSENVVGVTYPDLDAFFLLWIVRRFVTHFTNACLSLYVAEKTLTVTFNAQNRYEFMQRRSRSATCTLARPSTSF